MSIFISYLSHHIKNNRHTIINQTFVFIIVVVISACMQSKLPTDLVTTYNPNGGPRIDFNPFQTPLPDIPFPNDTVMKINRDTATGRSWNTSLIKPTKHEQDLRMLLNTLDGFGPSAPITVSFERPLDLNTVHRESIFVVNIEPGHPREGERVPLDFSDGFFPFEGQRHAYYGHDEFSMTPSLLFTEDNITDLDGDGVDEPIVHYDLTSNTLILRPIIPLAQDAKHAVILTSDVKGKTKSGEISSIQSPFKHKSFASQLKDVHRALVSLDLTADDLSFAWVYTTSNIVRPMQTLRDGLYDQGPLARLATQASSKIKGIRDTSILNDVQVEKEGASVRDHRYMLQADFLTGILKLMTQAQGNDSVVFDLNYVDYIVFGSWDTPNIRLTPQKTLSVNLHTGIGDIGIEEVPFLIAIPKTTDKHKPPFPMVLYFHGTGTSRFEALAIANQMARQGIAVISFDQVGHGPLLQDIDRLLAESDISEVLLQGIVRILVNLLAPDQISKFNDLSVSDSLERLKEVGLFAELAVHGRAEDYNQDGRFDPGESFFYSNPFSLCSSFTQDLVDFMQMVKVIRALSQDNVPATPLKNPQSATYQELEPYLLAGDFNADGILDIGGPNVALSVAGTSLGGIHAVMAGAIEPEVSVVTPIVAGAGLAQIISRSGLHFILDPLMQEIFGTRVIGCMHEGRLYLSLSNHANLCTESIEGSFASLPAPKIGTHVSLTNQNNKGSVKGSINDAGGFTLTISSDKKDRLLIEFYTNEEDKNGTMINSFEVETMIDGSGYQRNSYDFRMAFTVQQHIFDQCDPANFARHLFLDPLPGHAPKSVLFLNAIGDDTVPVSTSMILALASGVFGVTLDDWWDLMHILIEVGVFKNELYDVHDILKNNPKDQPAIDLFEPIQSGLGVSAMRLADVNGKHEWIIGYEKDDFNFGVYSQQQMSVFHACGGRIVLDFPTECLGDPKCEILDHLEDLEGCNPVGQAWRLQNNDLSK